jgi:hypothetical protein
LTDTADQNRERDAALSVSLASVIAASAAIAGCVTKAADASVSPASVTAKAATSARVEADESVSLASVIAAEAFRANVAADDTASPASVIAAAALSARVEADETVSPASVIEAVPEMLAVAVSLTPIERIVMLAVAPEPLMDTKSPAATLTELVISKNEPVAPSMIA